MTMSMTSTVKERPITFTGPLVPAILDGRKTMTRRVCKNPKVMGPFGIQEADRVVKYEPIGLPPEWSFRRPVRFPIEGDQSDAVESLGLIRCPYGVVGDRLWLKEVWRLDFDSGHGRKQSDGRYKRDAHYRVVYKAGGDDKSLLWEGYDEDVDPYGKALGCDDSWRSPRFMPRWASRITLEITGVRVERLHEISEADAMAEGAYAWLGSLDGRAYDIAKKAWCRRSRELDPATPVATPRGAFAALWDSINRKRPGCDWESNCWVWALSFRRLDAPREGKE